MHTVAGAGAGEGLFSLKPGNRNSLAERVTTFIGGLSRKQVGAAVLVIVAISYASFRYLTRPTYHSLISQIDDAKRQMMSTPKAESDRIRIVIEGVYQDIIRLGLVPIGKKEKREFYLDAQHLGIDISVPTIEVASLSQEEKRMLDNANQLFSAAAVALMQKTEKGEGAFRLAGDAEEVNELFDEFCQFTDEELTSEYLDKIYKSIDDGKENHFTLIKRIVTNLIPLGLDLNTECEDLIKIFNLILHDTSTKMTKETLMRAFPAATSAIRTIEVAS